MTDIVPDRQVQRRIVRYAGGLELRLPPGPRLLDTVVGRLRVLPCPD